MKRDRERIERLRRALREAGLDVLVCSLPQDVLLLSGYWPVLGISVGMVTREGEVKLVVPEDEELLAKQGWAEEVHTFSAGSLKELSPTRDQVQKVLKTVVGGLGLGRSRRIGYEDKEASVPVPYAALHVFGATLPGVIRAAIPGKLCSAGDLLERLRAVLTPGELGRVRAVCRNAQNAFEEGAKHLRPGLREPEAANRFKALLSASAKGMRAAQRADGWVWCMSGPNSAEAYAAFARTRERRIKPGDLVMIHGNSYADGFWTDITRTFVFGAARGKQRSMYAAVREASQAALAAIKPGVRGAVVDRAARAVLESHGFGKEFKHATGHGVGFSAISHNALPRLHPVSPDTLETGMVFNVEPAVYVRDFGGIRHCDMVTVTRNGAELLTDFQSRTEDLILS